MLALTLFILWTDGQRENQMRFCKFSLRKHRNTERVLFYCVIYSFFWCQGSSAEKCDEPRYLICQLPENARATAAQGGNRANVTALHARQETWRTFVHSLFVMGWLLFILLQSLSRWVWFSFLFWFWFALILAIKNTRLRTWLYEQSFYEF